MSVPAAPRSGDESGLNPLELKILEASPNYVWILKSPQKWVFINRLSCELLGNSNASFWCSAVHQNDMQLLIETLAQAWGQTESVSCELRIRAYNGLWRRIQHTFVSSQAEGTAGRMLIGTGFDVTEIRMTEKLLLARQRYLAAFSMLQKMAYHEKPLVSKLEAVQNISAQALDASSVKLYTLQQPGNFETLEAMAEDKVPESSENIRDLLASDGTREILVQGKPVLIDQETGKIVLFPLIFSKIWNGVIAIQCEEQTDFGRAETDFLNNVTSLLQVFLQQAAKAV